MPLTNGKRQGEGPKVPFPLYFYILESSAWYLDGKLAKQSQPNKNCQILTLNCIEDAPGKLLPSRRCSQHSSPRHHANVQHLNRILGWWMSASLAGSMDVCLCANQILKRTIFLLSLFENHFAQTSREMRFHLLNAHFHLCPQKIVWWEEWWLFPESAPRVLQGPFLISSFKILWFYIPSNMKLRV